MEVEIEKQLEVVHETTRKEKIKLYNPDAFDHKKEHRLMGIEITDEYTRIDFIMRASTLYVNGGWIQMERDAYISPIGSTTKYRLIQAIGIPIAPMKHYFKQQGEFHSYTLIFPALPADTKKINIIEKEAPGTYFNFYNIDYSKWITVPHPLYASQAEN